jgi:ankyrin repeat protein
VVKYLVEQAGADGGRARRDGVTPLILAAENGRADVVAYLVGRPGIDIHAQTIEGHRALDYASAFGGLEVVKLLVAAGARVTPQASNEVGALANAVIRGQLEVVKYLVEQAGADEQRAGRHGVTPLISAAEKGHADVVAYLLGRPGIDLGAKTAKGDSAVDMACREGHVEMVKQLVGAGAKVGYRALGSATVGGKLPVVRYLVEKAAAEQRRAIADGMTPLTHLQEVHCCDV